MGAGMTEARAPVKMAGEFVLIVVGVMVALVVDDYRQQRETNEATRAAVSLLIADLERDSVELARVAGYGHGSNANLSALLLNTDRADFPTDSAESAMHNLRLSAPINPVRATFDLLVQQDRLRYIGDIELQSLIVSYYEESQDRVVIWNAAYIDSYERYARQFARFMSPMARSVEEARASWYRGIETRLTVSWDVLRQDNLFMNSVYDRQVMGQLSDRYTLQALEANSALRVALHAVVSLD